MKYHASQTKKEPMAALAFKLATDPFVGVKSIFLRESTRVF